jgi:hypothetical protein
MKISEFLYEKGLYVLIVIVIIFGFIMKSLPTETTNNLNNIDISLTSKKFVLLLPEFLVLIMGKLFPFSLILSIILLFLVVYYANRLMTIRDKMHNNLKLEKDENKSESVTTSQNFVNEKWEKVLLLINSKNENDWKLAILECDIMLSDLLEKMGYMQESISEKLKAIEPSDFTNIESAWEAHKIRNNIAHEGSNFAINEREAKRVIGLYEIVFREFSYI